MFDFHEILPNTHAVRSLAFTFNQSSYYISPSSAAPPLTLFDAHEMADLIRRTIPRTDVAIAADIASHMETKNMSGRDFLNLSQTDLQTLSKNNEQVFRELEKLQQIPHSAMTYVSTRSPSIERGFPELASLIHNRRLPTAMLGQQFLEESFSHEAFDFGDDEEDVAPDLHSTVAMVNEVSPLPLPAPSPQAADPDIAVLQNDPSLLDPLIHPDTSVDPAQEDEPLLASSTSNLGDRLGQGNSNSGEPGLMNGNTPQNDLTTTTITFVPNTHAQPASASARDGATHMLSTENVHNAVPQPMQYESIASPMTSADEASVHALDESELVNPSDPQSAGGPERDITLLQNDSVLAGPDLPAQCHSLLDTRSSSPALSYVDNDPDAATQHSKIALDGNVPNPSTPADPNILLDQGRLPITSRHCSPTTELPSRSNSDSLGNSDSLEGSQLENSLTLSLDHPQTLINSDAPIAEDKEALAPPHSPASEPEATLSVPPSGVVYNPLDPPPSSEFLYAPNLKPYNPINDTRFDVDEASRGQTYETRQSSNASREGVSCAVNETDPDPPRHLNISFEDPHSSLAPNDTHEPSSSQPLSSSLTSFLEPTSPHPVDADIQSVTASTGEHLEEPLVDVSSTLSPLAHPSDLARLEVHHDLDFHPVPQSDPNEQSNVDMNIPASSSHGSAITLPFDTLPPIPVTPSNSPVFEGLSKYMILYDSDAPEVASQENAGIDPDRVSTPVQRELPARELTSCPPLEAPRIGLLSSSTSGNSQSPGNGSSSQPASTSSDPSDKSKETSGSDVDITTQPNPCCLHLSHRDLYLGMSNRGFSPFRRMQLGVLNVIPTFFTLDRETINRITSC